MWRSELAGRFDQRAHAERVVDDERASPIERANIQFERNDKPVVAVRQRKLDKQHASKIGWTGVYRTEVDLRIFKLPEARSRHAGETDGRGNRRACQPL